MNNKKEENTNINKKENINNKIFAKGWCFAKIFVFFMIGCLIGTYWEELLHWIEFHEGTNRQGVIWGPFSPIYGFGVAIFIIVLGKNNDKRGIIKTYLYSCLLGGFSEYAASFIADKAFNVKFWDYSNLFLNINGRTTIPIILGWGLGGFIILKVLYPFISKWIEKIPYKIGQAIYIALLTFMIINMILTYSAFGRMTLRENNVEAKTFIGRFLDEHFNTEYMYNKFPVMAKK